MTDQMLEWAARGAKARVKELEDELSAIAKQFPDMLPNRRSPAAPRVRKRKRTMSASARKAIGAAQRKRWAEKRAAESKKTK